MSPKKPFEKLAITEGKWETRFLKWFLLLLFLSLLINTWVFVLIHEEPRRGIITLEMLLKKDFLQPTVLGIPYFKKPPFHEWITSVISLLLGGVSEFSLRLPSAISVILTSIVLFYINKQFFKGKIALFSAIIYPTFYIVLIGYGSKCEPDALFSLLITLATLGWFFFFEKKREFTAWTIGYMFTSFALLTKGLPAIQFYLFFVLSHLLLNRKLNKLFSIQHFIGATLGLIPFTAWILAVKTDIAIKTLLSEIVSRAPGAVPVSKLLKSYFSFPIRFFTATFPWSIIFVYYAFRKKFPIVPENRILKVFAFAFSLDFLLYWLFPGSRLRYMMPALPLFATLLGYYLSNHTILHKRAKETIRFIAELIVPLAIIVGIVVSKNPSLILKSTLEFLIILYTIYFFFIPRFNFTYVVILVATLMLILRGFYSSYYYPIAQQKYPSVRKVALEIVKDSSGYPLYTRTSYLQLCFYVEKGRMEILKFSSSPPYDSLFLSQQPIGNVLKEYSLGNKKFYLCSFGIKSLTPQEAEEEPEKHSPGKQNHSKVKSASPGG